MITPLRRSGMAHILKGSHSFTCTPCIHPLMKWTILAFTFPAKAGTHLPTPEGWKAELALARVHFTKKIASMFRFFLKQKLFCLCHMCWCYCSECLLVNVVHFPDRGLDVAIWKADFWNSYLLDALTDAISDFNMFWWELNCSLSQCNQWAGHGYSLHLYSV